MNEIFRVGRYAVTVRTKDGKEPVHVKICTDGRPGKYGILWLTSEGAAEYDDRHRLNLTPAEAEGIMDAVIRNWGTIVGIWQTCYETAGFLH